VDRVVILAFDTSSALTSVALVDRTGVLTERSALDARRHAEVLAPLFADAMTGVDGTRVDAVACGVGPGPYTGLRVGIATALAVGTAWRVPVVGVCSLDAIAAAVVGLDAGEVDDGFCVATDARRHEVYWARYASDGRRLDGPRVGPPDDIEPSLLAGTWAGHGAFAYESTFGRVLGSSDPTLASGLAHAAWVGILAQALLDSGSVARDTDLTLDRHGEDSGATSQALRGAALLPPRPLYLRRPDAVEVGERR
jgi:tRNA threonylcarbamoyladenosine biosynthesis protein TsaB